MSSHESGGCPCHFPVIVPVMASKVLEESTENNLVVRVVGVVEANGFVNDKVVKHFGAFVGMLELVLKACFLGFVNPFAETETIGSSGSSGSRGVVVGVVLRAELIADHGQLRR